MREYREPLQRYSLRDQLSQRLERMILHHDVLPGETLPSERDLVETLGVSRTVVRDAIRILESKGLVEVRQGVGAVVTGDVRKAFEKALALLIERGSYPLTELMRLRMALEAEAASLAVENATEEDIAVMSRHLDEHREALLAGDFYRAAEADRAFHLCLLDATKSRPFIDLIAPLIRCLMSMTLVMLPGRHSHLEDNLTHRKIIDFIRERDPQAAAQQMRLTFRYGNETLRLLEQGVKCGDPDDVECSTLVSS